MTFQFSDRKLIPIHEKVIAEARLSFEDGVTLFQSLDLLGIGYLANIVRERKNGNIGYYNLNQHIDYTNVCILIDSGIVTVHMHLFMSLVTFLLM